jgi:3-oxoacyl-[acyl-carrier protein] reductase
MKMLEGKTVLITGASRGIGKGIAEVCAAQGANIAFTYLSSEQKANDLAKHLSNDSNKVIGYKSNAAKFDESEKLAADVLAEFGGVDVLVNNAGITRDNLLMRMTEDAWDEVMEINLKSVFNLTKAVQRIMLKKRSGSIINMTSIVGVRGNAGQSNYAASKAGIIGFSKSVAKELGGRNIRCNVITPGFIQTEMTDKLDTKVVEEWSKMVPLKRMGKTDDIANMAVFLASDMASYVTGQVISVCGGML